MTRRTSFAGTSTEGELFDGRGDDHATNRGRRRDPGEHLADQLAHGYEGLIDRLGTAREPAELEEVVDEGAEPVTLVDDGQVVPGHVDGIRDDALVEGLGECTDRRDRGSQIVRDPRHELPA